MRANNSPKSHLLGEGNDTADAAVGMDYKDLYQHRAIVPQSVRLLPHYEFSARFIGAGLSNIFSSMVTNPIAERTYEIISVRRAGEPITPKPEYSTIVSALTSVYNEGGGTLTGGLRSLWRGTVATVTRGAVITTAQIGSYDHFKQVVKNRKLMQEGVQLHVTASLFAGLVCSITSNPVDVIKVRLMNDRVRAYNGVVDGIIKTIRNESPLAFYKGFGMCWMRLGSHTTLTLILYEQLRAWAGVRPM
ncbi:hypothetical protein FRC12_023858 [Ceratobasidium sp. 428]|nr:hypothetical protein FRC12_023858 [Ceratobasidium sp. 428]